MFTTNLIDMFVSIAKEKTQIVKLFTIKNNEEKIIWEGAKSFYNFIDDDNKNFITSDDQNFIVVYESKVYFLVRNATGNSIASDLVSPGNPIAIQSVGSYGPVMIASKKNYALRKYILDLPVELQSIPNGIKDELFKDSDNLWKIRKNIGKKIITNLDTINYDGSISANMVRFYLLLQGHYTTSLDKDVLIISDRFKSSSRSNAISASGLNEELCFKGSTGSTTVAFHINKSRLNEISLNGVKEWLSRNNITIIYRLATPQIITLSQNIQDILNSELEVFKDSEILITDTRTNGQIVGTLIEEGGQ